MNNLTGVSGIREGGGCGHFLEPAVPICWCSSLVFIIPLYVEVKNSVLLEQMKKICFNLNHADKSPIVPILNIVGTYSKIKKNEKNLF